ncbi:MAG: glycosyltransferase family 4 protein [Balneolales bacterium]
MAINILHINQNLSVAGGGITQMIRDFSPALSKLGANIYCLTAEDIELTPSGIKENIFLPEVDEPNGSVNKWKPVLENTLIHKSIDIVHIHEVKNLDMVLYLADKIPVVIHLHNYGWWCPGNDQFYASSDDICPLSTGWKCIPNAYTKRCNNRHPKRLIPSIINGYKKKKLWDENVRFIASSDYMRRRATHAGIAFSKISVVPYAVDSDRFSDDSREPVEGLEPGYILYVGRFAQSKGVEYLIDAFSYIENFNRQLVLVGDGSHRSKIESHIKRLKLGNKVILLGWREGDELSRLFHNCSMLAVPSVWNEVFGIIGLEAMAASKPVVAFDVGGISQWLDDNITGYLVTRKDIREFSVKMALLLRDTKLADDMGQFGYERYQREFTTDIQAENLLNVYNMSIDNNVTMKV